MYVFIHFCMYTYIHKNVFINLNEYFSFFKTGIDSELKASIKEQRYNPTYIESIKSNRKQQ